MNFDPNNLNETLMIPGGELRFNAPVERLPRVAFEEPHLGRCLHCKDDQDVPGPVKMLRDDNTGQLLPERCQCFLCGQRYRVAWEDLEAFLGYPPSAEGMYWGPNHRSVYDDWQPSKIE